MKPNPLEISHRLYGLTLLLVLAIMLVGGLSALQMKRIAQGAQQISDRWPASLCPALELEVGSRNVRVRQLRYWLEHPSFAAGTGLQDLQRRSRVRLAPGSGASAHHPTNTHFAGR